MRACPRDHFITEAHQDEAFSDSPVRLDDLDFNVSAPHMHASCLEALQLQPGQHVLDVGTGCGIIAACAAHMVSATGFALSTFYHAWILALAATLLLLVLLLW